MPGCGVLEWEYPSLMLKWNRYRHSLPHGRQIRRDTRYISFSVYKQRVRESESMTRSPWDYTDDMQSIYHDLPYPGKAKFLIQFRLCHVLII